MFFRRSYKPELMDDFSIIDDRIDQALIELKIINKYLGGNAASQTGFKELMKNIPRDSALKILDAGCGASDIILPISEVYSNLKVFGLDINHRTCFYAKRHSPKLTTICGNVLTVPFKNNTFDLVHTSLFLHHFRENEVKLILEALLETVKYGIVINDLRRSILAYWGIKVLTFLFSKSELVKNDGPLSVKRGFVKNELLKIFDELKIKNYKIKRTHMFRWLIVIYKNEIDKI